MALVNHLLRCTCKLLTRRTSNLVNKLRTRESGKRLLQSCSQSNGPPQKTLKNTGEASHLRLPRMYMCGCQNYDPFFGDPKYKVPYYDRVQEGTIILTTIHMCRRSRCVAVLCLPGNYTKNDACGRETVNPCCWRQKSDTARRRSFTNLITFYPDKC